MNEQALTWFLIISVAFLVVNAYWLAAFGLFRRRVEAAAERHGRRPIVASLLGLAVLTPLVLLAGAAITSGGDTGIGVIALVLLGIPLLLALLGSAGLAWRIGSGMGSASDSAQPWRIQLRGGLVLALCFLMPFLGWFLILPWALASGFGVALIGLFARDGADPAAPASTRSLPKVDVDSDAAIGDQRG